MPGAQAGRPRKPSKASGLLQPARHRDADIAAIADLPRGVEQAAGRGDLPFSIAIEKPAPRGRFERLDEIWTFQ
jgi:hypothetical protein